MVLQAAIHGQGVALGNSVLAKPEIESGRLVTPFNEVLVSKNAFYLVCREGQVDSPKIVAFRNWLLESVRVEQDHD
jgi:LysR family glycine cleavage system transcriptional activator